MPPEWMERITSKEEEPLWSTGWIPLEPQEHKQQEHPYQGHGCWADLGTIAPTPYSGWAYTLDATPSTYDDRTQLWVFGLRAHTMALGQLKRLGALTGVPKGDQTKARALLAGVVALAKHTTTPAKVIVQIATVWEAWHQPRSRPPFQDILEDITDQDYSRISVLYIPRQTRTPDAPGNEPQLRKRQRDSALAAWERSKQFQNPKQDEWQEILDADHRQTYRHAIQRLAKIFEDPQHYIHQKAPKHQGKNTKNFKRDLVRQCAHKWTDNHHRWEPHRSGYQCTACGARMHQGLTKDILETRLQEDCPQVKLADVYSQPAKEEPLTKKPTRAQLIKDILHRQHQQPPAPEEHQYAETTGYLKCLKCGVHSLWQKGERVRCIQCGAAWNLDAEQRIITNQQLSKVCKGASAKGSPPLSDFFKKKDPSTSSSTQPHNTAAAAKATQPTPRRLSFQTALDALEQDEALTHTMSAQAMNPSRSADDESDNREDQLGYAVEYF